MTGTLNPQRLCDATVVYDLISASSPLCLQ